MTVSVLHDVADFRAACDAIRKNGGSIGLVPTMGALHAGHLALVERAARSATHAAVTIFVNPTQFGPKEDLARYPRDLAGDVEKCSRAGAALVFAPPVEAMYPAGERTRVRVDELTRHLCGASRPGHFEGVATIVTKLFAVTGPSTAIFGRKDYQQLKVIERMARDLLLPVKVVSHATVRDPDGLAMSSRNAYLSPAERRAGLAIPRALALAAARFQAGERNVEELAELAGSTLERAGLRVDYASLADADELEPFAAGALLPERALLAIAAYAGTTRLIDNMVLGEDPPPPVELAGVEA
jgi:pantoate--beta-alanine ligase